MRAVAFGPGAKVESKLAEFPVVAGHFTFALEYADQHFALTGEPRW